MGAYGGEEDRQTPFLATPSTESNGYNGHSKRTGTLWTAVAHIITAVIGSGVLSLAWSVAQLGWIAGPLAMLGFAGITMVSSYLLCDCYRTPDPETGHVRNPTYMKAVRLYLGEKSVWICGVFQQISLFGTGIAYTITSSISMRIEFNTPECIVLTHPGAWLGSYMRSINWHEKQSTDDDSLSDFETCPFIYQARNSH